MTPEFKIKLDAKLSAYHQWLATHPITSCRLVHYCGVDVPNAIDVPLENVVKEITGCLAEGFYVDWHADGQRLFICVQEPDCPIPSWERVLSEQPIADVDAILRDAGLDPRA